MIPIDNPAIASLLKKKQATILVTDSGLGGMAIFAEIAARLKSEPIFSHADLVYYNAWPEQHRGYNGLRDMDERIRVFDRALAGMERYQPDIIMIACNTLSVLYDRTEFSRRQAIPVIDIVGFGTDMVYEDLSGRPDRTALLLGTVTTVASGVHRSALVDRGILPARIVTQPCDQLATQIEKSPGSDTVAQMVDGFMARAAEKLGPEGCDVAVALFCTHFGYCRDLIKETLQRRTRGRVTVLDPNRAMAACLFEAAGGSRHQDAVVDLQVVSRIVWDREKIDAIAAAVKSQSAETASALHRYAHIPDLFTF